MANIKKPWKVYIVECLDSSLYTGVTNDIERRMKMHSFGNGSKYIRAKGFSKLIASKDCLSKSEACKYEYHIKQLSRENKIKWFK